VLEAKRTDWIGTVYLVPPRSGWAFLAVALCSVAAVFSLVALGSYTRHQEIPGKLVPRDGVLIVASDVSGVLLKMLVHEGDSVARGQPLFELSTDQSSPIIGDTHFAEGQELELKRSHLRSEIAQLTRVAARDLRDMRDRMALLLEQQKILVEQIAIQQERVTDNEERYKTWSEAARTGAVSKLQLSQQKENTQQQLIQLKALGADNVRLNQQIGQLRSQIDEHSDLSSGRTSERERELADVSQSYEENAARASISVNAPADGIVANVFRYVGQHAITNQPVLTLLPRSSPLVAELWVPSRAVGEIREGAPVIMRYDAFPYQHFGLHVGLVRNVSLNAVLPVDLKEMQGTEVNEPKYRVEVLLDTQVLSGRGERAILRPGMTLEASVFLERRRLIEWLAAPLYEPVRDFINKQAVESTLTRSIHAN